ncbi:MAG: tRNA epoxyqueuosine(34) reductase QueG, partial [Anaerolineales bacterium]
VTTPHPPESFPRFQAWVEAGRHAEMGYLATERNLQRRSDPTEILSECQSILVLGIPYTPAGSQQGGVASYAQGDDYHEALKPRLAALVKFLETAAGHPVPNRWYTDTGPVLERDLARRAGLGWIGKNSMLINPQKGSYFLLAEILLGISLPPDAPFETDHCGTCTRCLDACPTACIRLDRTLEAGRCLSYLTIENKGEIPLDLRPQVGDWLFGCDVCQQVCPWNRFATHPANQAFVPREDIPPQDPAAELSLTPQQFNRKFKNSPVKRAKRRGYLRNVAVALGNQASPAHILALSIALHDPEPLVRQHAAWALGQIGGEEVITTLRQHAEIDTDPAVLGEVWEILARF